MGRKIKTSQGKRDQDIIRVEISRHHKGRKGERSDWANGGSRSIVGLDMHTHVHVPIQRKTDKHSHTYTHIDQCSDQETPSYNAPSHV